MLIKPGFGQTYRRVALFFPLIILSAVLVVWSSLQTVGNVSKKADSLVSRHIPELRELSALQWVMNQRIILLHEYYATTERPSEEVLDNLRNAFSRHLVNLRFLGLDDSEITMFKSPLAKFQSSAALFDQEMQLGSARDWDKLREYLAASTEQANMANRELKEWIERVRERLGAGSEETLDEIGRLNSLQLSFGLTVLFIAILLLAILYARMKDQAKLQYRAYHDELTDLPNRRSLQTYAKKALSLNNQPECMAILFVSLDRFPLITSTFGHLLGDQLLKRFSTELEKLLEHHGVDSRLFSFGRANWIVCVDEPESGSTSIEIADAIERFTVQPLILNERELNVSCSIGVAYFPSDAENLESLLRKADTARREALASGGSGYRVYEARMSLESERVLSIESGLRNALKNDEFELYFQPKLSIHGDKVACAEALIRWNRGDEFISPGDFIPVAEQTGLVVPLGEWVLRRACKHWVDWFEAGIECPPIAINISAQQFQLDDFPDLVKKVLIETGMPAKKLELEITEEAASGKPEQVVKAMYALKAIGVSLAIDDFGTGYSSLSYLKRFPIDVLKIDRAFVSQMENSSQDKAIVDMVITMAHELNFEVVAEGVETEAQWQLLREMKCDLLQGFLFSRPLPAHTYIDHLNSYSLDILDKPIP